MVEGQKPEVGAGRESGIAPATGSRGRDADYRAGEIDLLDLFRRAWRYRWMVLGFGAAAVVTAILYLRLSTPLYTARLSVVPVQDSQSGASRGLGGLAGIASLAGMGLPVDPGAMSFLMYKEGIASRSVAVALLGQPEVVTILFSGEWNEATGRFQAPRRGLKGALIGTVRKLIGSKVQAWRPPDGARVQAYIQEQVRVSEDPERPVLRLSYDHADPAFAVLFLERLHSALDESLRQRARARAQAHIEHLSSQLANARVLEHRNAIADSLSQQEKSLMLASSPLAYAADPLDVVTASHRPTHPRPSLVLPLSLLLGLMLGLGVAVIRALRPRKGSEELPSR